MSVLHTDPLNWEKLAIHALADQEEIQGGEEFGNKILYVNLSNVPGFGRLKVTLINPSLVNTTSFPTILKVEGDGFVCRIAYSGIGYLPPNNYSFPAAIKVVLKNEILIDELEERIMIYLLSRE